MRRRVGGGGPLGPRPDEPGPPVGGPLTYEPDVEAALAVDAAVIIARYPSSRSALLPLLHLVQAQDGYLTAADFVDPASFNFTLNPTTSASASFPSGGGGTDGKDCGYDHAYLTTMLADLGG